jgi:enoyl-CoA hydratase/carnithine racemase
VAYDYERLRVRVEDGVAFATLASPPLNVMTLHLFGDLSRFAVEAQNDPAVRALVLRSDDPDFWIAHFDVEAILGFPVDGPAQRASASAACRRRPSPRSAGAWAAAATSWP